MSSNILTVVYIQVTNIQLVVPGVSTVPPFLMTPKSGTTESLTPCTLPSISPRTRGLPSIGVLLGQAHRASKSICSSGPEDSSLYREGARAASRADKSRTLEREVGLEKF